VSKFHPHTCVLKNGEPITLREGVENDAAAIRACLQVYLKDGAGQLWEPGEFEPSEEQEREWIRGLAVNPREILLVAEHRGRIIGNLDFHIGPRRRLAHGGEFGMSCLPDWRGLGLGTLLLESFLNWARLQTGIEQINLRMVGTNSTARALYEKLGFREDGRKVRHVKYADGTYADEIHMGLSL
jgi:RimJ/RimL family protein N-acetyltransferase